MQANSSVRFLFATDVKKMQEMIDAHFLQNQNWEITSVSHVYVPNGVSVALGLKFVGQQSSQFEIPSFE